MRTILGIDPALNNVGYCILLYDENADRIEDIKYGVYDINPKIKTEDKLNAIFLTTKKIVRDYEIDDVALEKVYHNPKMARGGFLVREVLGALKVAIVQENKSIYYYTPQRIKKNIAGNGKADKLVVAKTIAELLGIPCFKVQKRVRGKNVVLCLTPEELIRRRLDHISDAISIAFCRLLELRTEQKEAV